MLKTIKQAPSPEAGGWRFTYFFRPFKVLTQVFWLQVLTLAASISAGILKRGATPQNLQEEVQHVLELQQYESGQQQQGDGGAPIPYQGGFCGGPSALGVDDAVSALQDAIDWMRLRNYSLPGAHIPPCSTNSRNK